MKDMKLFVFAAGILLMGLLNSCESESKDSAVSIRFNNPTEADSVFASDSYNLNVGIIAEGPIKTIQFYHSTPTSNRKDSALEISAAKLENPSNSTCNFTIKVPNITYSQNIWAVVTEKSGKVVSSMYRINVRTININVYSSMKMGGWNSSFGSALDLDLGTTYGSAALATSGSIIDIFFDGGTIASTDLDATVLYASSYPKGARFADTGTKFAPTSLTAANFDSYKADDNFKAMTGLFKAIDVKVGDVVFFQTTGGKKGLLKIVSMTNPLGDLVVNEKIQK